MPSRFNRCSNNLERRLATAGTASSSIRVRRASRPASRDHRAKAKGQAASSKGDSSGVHDVETKQGLAVEARSGRVVSDLPKFLADSGKRKKGLDAPMFVRLSLFCNLYHARQDRSRETA